MCVIIITENILFVEVIERISITMDRWNIKD